MNEQNQFNFDVTPPTSPYLRGGQEGLTFKENLLLGFLRTGRQNAQGVVFLSSMLKVSEVRLRMMVKHLVEDHGFVIVSSTGKNPGYFFPDGHEEFTKGVNQLINRIRSLAVRLRALDKSKYEIIFGQGNLLDNPTNLPLDKGRQGGVI